MTKPTYIIHRHGGKDGGPTYTDDLDEAQQAAADYALKNPGHRGEVAELIFSYQALKGGQHFETIHRPRATGGGGNAA